MTDPKPAFHDYEISDSGKLAAAGDPGPIWSLQGWASMVWSLWFVAGCLIFSIGLTGLHVGGILVETNGRPTFIIDRELAGSPSGPGQFKSVTVQDGASS